MKTTAQKIHSLVSKEEEAISRLENEIASLSKLIDSHKRDIELAKARKDAFDLALNAIGAAPELKAGNNNKIEQMTRHDLPLGAKPTRNKPLSDQWKSVLRFVGFHGATNASVLQHLESIGVPMTANNVRSQVSNLSKGGYLEKLGPGRFKLTELGAEACGFTNGEAPSAANTEGFDLLNPSV